VPLLFATRVNVISRVGDTLNSPERCIVRLADGSTRTAYVKEIPTREIAVEVTCAILGNLLGLPVPDPILVRVPGENAIRFGSALINAPPFVQFLNADAAVIARLKSWPQVVPAACFDEWIANRDRHAGNVLHDGGAGFWLIDHGQAAEATQRADALSAANHLFNVTRDGASDVDVELKLRPAMQASMQGFTNINMSHVRDAIGIRIGETDEVLGWLSDRQPYLLRFVAQRLPSPERDMFNDAYP
jgi:hypothetical protein